MTTSLSKAPVPRPRQCWQQQPPNSKTTPSPSGNNSARIQLSDDDVYRFLGKQFCLPRSPASASAPSGTEASQPISHPVSATAAATAAAAKAPPKPPRSINVSASAAGYSKAPKPLPRTMFLAVKTPPTRPSRPPVSYTLRNQTNPAEPNGIKSFGNVKM